MILVTGASRGIGRGTAVGLAAPGTTIYVTGRTTQRRQRTAAGNHSRDGRRDHPPRRAGASPSPAITPTMPRWRALFAQIARDSKRLDVLVNNVTAIPDELVLPGGFWEKPLSMQAILDVGLRSHYVASWHAARMMVPERRGLIVMISSPGARCYLHGPAYGAGKAGIDKMSADMAVDLKKYGVASVSLWAGLTLTERSQVAMREHPGTMRR